MKRKTTEGILGVALIFLAALVGCQQPQSLSSSTDVISVRVGNVAATSLGVPSSDWATATAGLVTISNAQSRNVTVTASPAQGGSYVYYSVAESATKPSFVEASKASYTFVKSDNTFLYVKVYSENKDQLSYYKLKVVVVEDTPLLDDVTLAGRSATGFSADYRVAVQKFGTGLGKPTADPVTTEAGEIWFGTSQAGKDLAVTAIPMISGITTTNFIATPDATTAPVFVDPVPTTVKATDGGYLWVKSFLTANPTTVLFYKFKLVQKGDNRGLSSVVINGTTMTVGTMGTESFPGSESYGSYVNGAKLATTGNKSIYSSMDKLHGLDSVTMQAVPVDPKTTVAYDVADAALKMKDYLVFRHEPIRTDNTTGLFSNLVSGQYLAIQVVSEIGEKGWYNFLVATGQTDSTVSGVTVGGVTATLGSPLDIVYGSFLQAPTGKTWGAVTLPTPSGTTVVVPALPSTASLAKVEYAVAGTFYGVFITMPTAWNTTGSFAAGSITSANNNLVLKVTSDSGTSVTYYAVQVTLQ